MKNNLMLINPCYGTTYIRHINGLYLTMQNNTLCLSKDRFLWRIESFENDRFYLKDLTGHDNAEYWWGQFQVAVDSGYTEQHWRLYRKKDNIIIEHADSKTFLFYSNDENLTLKDGNEDNESYYFYFENPSLTEGFPYIEIKSNTNKISLRMEPRILNYVNDKWLLDWANDLEKVVFSLSRLTGLMPFSTIEIRTYTNCNNWGYIYYGKPVVHINNECMLNEIIRMRKQKIRDVSVGMLHELSHLFDKYDWLFDGEALANIKIPYILYEQGFTITMGTGDEVSYHNFAEGLYKENGKLDNIHGIFCSSLAAKITEITYSIGWDAVSKTFKNFPSIENESKIVRFETFINKLSEYSNTDVRNMFSNEEWNIIIKNLSN